MSRLKLNTDLTARQRQTFGKRLLRLEAYLAALPPKAYDHSGYISERNQCGTVACALGHAVASKLFRGLQIKLSRDTYNNWTITPAYSVDRDADAYFGPETYSEVFSSFAYSQTLRGRVSVATVRAKLRKVAAKRYGVTTA